MKNRGFLHQISNLLVRAGWTNLALLITLALTLPLTTPSEHDPNLNPNPTPAVTLIHLPALAQSKSNLAVTPLSAFYFFGGRGANGIFAPSRPEAKCRVRPDVTPMNF